MVSHGGKFERMIRRLSLACLPALAVSAFPRPHHAPLGVFTHFVSLSNHFAWCGKLGPTELCFWVSFWKMEVMRTPLVWVELVICCLIGQGVKSVREDKSPGSGHVSQAETEAKTPTSLRTCFLHLFLTRSSPEKEEEPGFNQRSRSYEESVGSSSWGHVKGARDDDLEKLDTNPAT